MTIDSLIEALRYNQGYFPAQAVAEAQDNPSELSPLMLDELANAAKDPAYVLDKGNDYFLHLYAMFLLARWRESKAFPLLIDLFSHDAATCEMIAGDMITEDLPMIFASVYDGRLEQLDRLVQDPATSEWVRAAAIESLLVLLAEGVLDQETVKSHYQSWFQYYLKLKPSDDFALTELMMCCRSLDGFQEFLPDIERAYRLDLADEAAVTLEEIREGLDDFEIAHTNNRHQFIEDVVKGLENWACFDPENADPFDEGGMSIDDWPYPGVVEPYNAPPKVGRNEPCPCGSGRKYKKCCLVSTDD